MPKIFKNFLKPEVNEYLFQSAADLVVENDGAPEIIPMEEPVEDLHDESEEADVEEHSDEQEIRFAGIQADAIMADARKEAQSLEEETRARLAAYEEQARREIDAELERERSDARKEGFEQGYADGMAQAAEESRQQLEKQAKEQIEAVEAFLTQAARERDRILDASREELKDLAIAIAEKVIRISLKNSSDILLRMVDAATDTHKRCEWAHIYVADSDLNGKAYTVPELTAALGHVSNRIRVIPMADDEPGTCIVELPDVILDASVSTQLGAIREVLSGVSLDGT